MANLRFVEINTPKQAELQRHKLKSVWSNETQLTQRILIRCFELLQQIADTIQPRRTRPPSEWNKFFAKAIRRGLTPKQAGQEWRNRKVAKIA
jgi:hypothetical protein